jgi:hypothetical protein
LVEGWLRRQPTLEASEIYERLVAEHRLDRHDQ